MSSIDIEAIDSVFRQVQREVWIVTAADGQRRGGLVATWVSQSSIDPESPQAVIAIAANHFTAELIDAAHCFALHLITADQIDLAWRFCMGSGRDRDKLAGLETTVAKTGCPILTDCLAWLDCKVISRHDTGDRIFYWADVVAGQLIGQGTPLREQELMATATPEQKSQLLGSLKDDLQIQRPLRQHWRDGLTGQS